MKDLINKNKFEQLAEKTAENAVSIYLPSNKDRWIDPLQDKNRIKLKNLIKDISGELKEKGMEDEEVKKFLEPLNDFIEDDSEWGYLMEGMAIFLSNDLFEYYILPIAQEEMYYRGNRFYLQPLVPVLNTNHTFYILSLSMKGVELFRANLFDIEKLNIEQFVPSTIEEALGHDYEEKVLQYRGEQEGEGKAMFHGQNVGEEVKKKETEKFIRYVNDGIMDALDHRHEKLIIASVDYLFAQYKEINAYPNLAEEHISLSPKDFKPKELKEKAIDIIRKDLAKLKHEKKEAYREAVDKTNVEETVVSAAHIGQIDTLFLNQDEMIWGKFDKDSNKSELHEEYKEGDISLNNFAAIHTFLKNGQVFLMKKKDMPDGSRPMNAILRYEI